VGRTVLSEYGAGFVRKGSCQGTPSDVPIRVAITVKRDRRSSRELKLALCLKNIDIAAWLKARPDTTPQS